jgi:hypothetical protein
VLAGAAATSVLAASVILTPAAFAAVPAAPQQASVADRSGPARNVIVLLKNQHAEAPATPLTLGVRRQRVQADQAPVKRQVQSAGGMLGPSYTTLNGFAASVPAGDLPALRADPAIAAVVPDLPLIRPRAHPDAPTPAPAPGTSPAPTPAGACPSDPAKPQLEPQALQVTHTNSDDPSAPTARKLGATGAGVKVAFIADGLDVNNPDFIRADGTHVITDYKDFSGDGTAAPTDGAEAFGDASSIAAQGRVSYDLSTYVNPAAQTLPAGCTIRIEGVAPGAQMVALKVFGGQTAPTSGFLAAIEYAVDTDQVNVINESFGGNPYPDNGTDPISIFDENAVAAGVTVVASSGDAGIGGTVGAPASSPGVIDVGASTTFRLYSQIGYSGFPLSNGSYADDQSSALSSSGITQGGFTPGPFIPGRYSTSGAPRDPRTLDLLAPGDLNWSVCSTDPTYTGCTNTTGKPSPFISFGGTSESSPFTAGAAALVIESFRAAHGGTSPTPDEVRRIIDSSADDLGLPAQEQGAGRLNTYRAVQLARSAAAGPGAGSGGLLLSSPGLTGHGPPGATLTRTVTVTNRGGTGRQVAASLRAVDDPVSTVTTQTILTPGTADGSFVDAVGVTRIFRRVAFSVPAGADRVEVDGSGSGSGSGSGQGSTVLRLALLDPTGRYTAYSLPQGTGNNAVTDLHDPAPGRWTAIVFSSAGPAGYHGPVSLRVAATRVRPAGTVSPAEFALPAGASRTLTLTTTAPRSGSTAASLVLAGTGLGSIYSGTGASSLPVVTTAVSPVTPAGVTITGTFTNGNGRSYSPGQTDSYLLDVPAGQRALNVDLRQPAADPNNVSVFLVSPEGQPLGLETNQKPVFGGGTRFSPGLTTATLAPQPGRWTLVVVLNNPVSGARLPQPYTATVSFRSLAVTATGLPQGAVLTPGRPVTGQLRVTNNGPAQEAIFLDPRTSSLASYTLAPQSPTQDLALHPAAGSIPPAPTWLVPTQSTAFALAGSATGPAFFDTYPVQTTAPDVESTFGTAPKASITATELSPGQWTASPGEIGPFGADAAPAGTISLTGTVTTLAFDDTVSTPTGDYWRQSIDPAATVAPVVLPQGASATLPVTFTPRGARGTVVAGRLFVDTENPVTSSGSELAVLAYRYTVG